MDEEFELPEYELVGDSLANSIKSEFDELNALTYGHYRSGRQYVQGYKENISNRFNHNSVASLGVNFAGYFGDEDNITKINDNWRSNNSISDGNFYDLIYNEGNQSEVLTYARSFSQGKLDYYSIYNNDLSELRNVSDYTNSMYNAIMSGNFENFKNNNNSNDIKECQELINNIWGIATEFDKKYYDGQKKVLPIRISIDEINEGYFNKYATSNLTKYGIKYVKGSQMGKDKNINSVNASEDPLTEFINRYRNEYDLASSDGVGWIFVPADKKQFLPLILAQFSDCRSHDYTNQSQIDSKIDKRYAIPDPINMNGEKEGHHLYSLGRNMGILYPEFTFDGIDSPVGSGVSAMQLSSLGGIAGLIGGPLALGFDVAALEDVRSSLPNYSMSDYIDIGNKLYKVIEDVENKNINENSYEFVTSEGNTMSALPQSRLEALIRSGQLAPSVAKDILKNQVNLIHHLKNIPFTDYNYNVYMEGPTGEFMPATFEAKKVMQDALSQLKDNQLNLKMVSNGSSYADGTIAYYEVSIPNSVLLENSIGSAGLARFKENMKKDEESDKLRTLLESSPTVTLDFDNESDDVVKSFNLNGVTKFRVPVNVVDSPDSDLYSNPLVVNANELNNFGNQNARMQLLKDSYFGDVAILSDHVNGDKGTQLKPYKFDFDGKHNMTDKNIQDKYTAPIYNDYAEIEQLMQATRDYMPYEEIVRYYKNKYGDDWKANIPANYLDAFIKNYANVYNKLSDLTEVTGDTQTKVEDRQYLFGGGQLLRFLNDIKALDEDIYDLICKDINIKPD